MFQYEYAVTRISPGNNIEAEKTLNGFGAKGFHVVAFVPFNLDVFLLMEREQVPTTGTAEPEKKVRKATVKSETE